MKIEKPASNISSGSGNNQTALNGKFLQILPIPLLIVVAAIVYMNSLSNDFVYDDISTIVENVHIKHFGKNLPSFFNRSYFKIAHGESSYRPVATLSYYLLYALFELKPFGYHLFSLVLHIFNVVLVYLLANLIINNKISSLIAGLLFACHPVLTEAVDCISFNDDLLAALFFFLALFLYVKLKTTAIKGNLIIYISSLVCFLLGLLSKEMAITLPIIIVVYDLTLRGPAPRPFSLKPVVNTLVKRKHFYIGYAAVTLFYLWVRFLILNNPQESVNAGWGSLFERIIYLPVLFFDYIKLIIFPLNLNADYVFSYPARFFQACNIVSYLLVTGLIIFSFMIYKRSSAISFGIWWFFITLLPVYNLMEIYNPIAERYLYIPLFGFCLVIPLLMVNLLRRISFAPQTVLTFSAVLIIVVFYAVIAIDRNRDWRDSYSLWIRTLETSPDSVKAHGNLARVYLEQGLLEQSWREIKKTIELDPRDYKAYHNLGVLLAKQGLSSDAIQAYKKAIEKNPKYADAHFNLGNIYKELDLRQEALQEYKKVIEIDPEDIEARNNLGVVYAIEGKLEAAIAAWEKVLEIETDNREALDNILKAKKLLLEDPAYQADPQRKTPKLKPNPDKPELNIED
jgi:tetratricopeptide (TPR) repeat protein